MIEVISKWQENVLFASHKVHVNHKIGGNELLWCLKEHKKEKTPSTLKIGGNLNLDHTFKQRILLTYAFKTLVNESNLEKFCWNLCIEFNFVTFN